MEHYTALVPTLLSPGHHSNPLCPVQIFGQVAAVSRDAGDPERPVCSLRAGADTFLAVMGVAVTLVLPALLGTAHTSPSCCSPLQLIESPLFAAGKSPVCGGVTARASLHSLEICNVKWWQIVKCVKLELFVIFPKCFINKQHWWLTFYLNGLGGRHFSA